LRATSLDTAEGEGDQLDVKSLQNQLEKTQDLVGQLSKQLMELKDQVREDFGFALKLQFVFKVL
jgi:inositol 1,4,5-triphosphate receptor type 1